MSKRMTRREFLRAAAVAAASAAVSGGCGPGPTAGPAATQAPGATVAPTKAPAATAIPEIEITVAREEHPFHPLRDDTPTHNAIAERTGIRMHLLKIPGEDWNTKRKVWLSTNQVPDLLHCQKGHIRDYARQGPLLELTPLIEQHAPNLQKYILDNADVMGKLSIGGELYYIPGLKYNWKLNSPMPMIRMDLLDKLGIEHPTDFDELLEALEAIKVDDPDTVGWSCRLGTRRLLQYAQYAMGSGFPMYFDKDVDGGKWLYGAVHEEFKYGLDWFAQAYAVGVLDPDYANLPPDQWAEKNGSGEAVFYYDNMNQGIRYNAAIKQVNPDGWWAPLEILEGQKGRRQWHYPFWWDGWAIGSTTEHAERLIKFLDWMVSPEGLDLTNWGIEGEHYVYKEGQSRPDQIDDYTPDGVTEALWWKNKELPDAIREQYADASDPQRALSTDIGTGMLDVVAFRDCADTYVWQDEDNPYEAWYELLQSDPMLPHGSVYLEPDFTEEEGDRILELNTDIDTVLDPAYDKVIIGEMSLDEYDAEVEKVADKAQELEDIYNEAQARI